MTRFCALSTSVSTGLICHDPMMRTLQQSKRNQDVASKMAARAKVTVFEFVQVSVAKDITDWVKGVNSTIQ